MINKTIPAFIIALIIFPPTKSEALKKLGFEEEFYYVGASVGQSFSQEKMIDDAQFFNGSIGYIMDKNFRAEIEISHRSSDLTNVAGYKIEGSNELTAVMFNGIYDFKNKTIFTPYVSLGAGFGMDNLTIDNVFPGIDDSAFTFVYQVGTGVSLDIYKGLKLSAGYNFLDTGAFNYNYVILVNGNKAAELKDYTAHELRTGIRYEF